jgi:ATP-binding cassette subfamily C (CFTR/MRP) protein 1
VFKVSATDWSFCLPTHVATPVGSAGISLSGGQKQRLALARALYARNELVMLDDIFSGLDAETEEHIFNKLLGKNGLFRQLETTVLLATHAVHRLSYSDNIIALSGDGRVVEQGSFEQLRNAGGYVQSLAARIKNEDTPTSTSKKLNDTAQPTAPKPDNEEEIEELNRQTGDFAVYKYYFASIGWFSNFLFFAYVVLYGVASKMTEFLVTYWTRASAIRGNEVNGFYIGLYAMLALIGTLELVMAAFQLALVMVPRSAEVLHGRLLNTVMNAPLSLFT